MGGDAQVRLVRATKAYEGTEKPSGGLQKRRAGKGGFLLWGWLLKKEELEWNSC